MIRASYYSKRLRRVILKRYKSNRTFMKAKRALYKRGLRLKKVFVFRTRY